MKWPFAPAHLDREHAIMLDCYCIERIERALSQLRADTTLRNAGSTGCTGGRATRRRDLRRGLRHLRLRVCSCSVGALGQQLPVSFGSRLERERQRREVQHRALRIAQRVAARTHVCQQRRGGGEGGAP